MRKQKLIEKDMLQLSLEDIKRYLLENHWESKEYPSKKIDVFLGPHADDGNQVEILLPKGREYQDYFLRISDALKILSVIGEKDYNTLIREISLTSHDVFKVRILNVGPSGTIPLTEASDDISALKNLFIYAACSEEKSLPYYEKPLPGGLDHAEMCRFGHTFEGSFGFTINSPIISDYCQLAMFGAKEETPFERRVMERIIRSFSLIEKSVLEDDANFLVENFDIGLNAKMCEALLDISSSKTKEICFDVLWSPKIEVSEDIKQKQTWKLNKASYEVLEFAADELKKIQPFRETIVGQIVTLHSSRNPMSEEVFNRQITVKYVLDGRTIYIKLALDRSGYRTAYEAHGKGLPVKVTGQLFRKGNVWKMVDVEEISIVFI